MGGKLGAPAALVPRLAAPVPLAGLHAALTELLLPLNSRLVGLHCLLHHPRGAGRGGRSVLTPISPSSGFYLCYESLHAPSYP